MRTMRGQTKEQVSREVCVTILDNPYATNIEKKLAGACLLLLDECESLRVDKARLDWLERNGAPQSTFNGPWEFSAREAIDAAISENAAPDKLAQPPDVTCLDCGTRVRFGSPCPNCGLGDDR